MLLPLAVLSAAFLSGASAGAFAQAYPNRPIHIVAPFPAGGGYDFLARLVGQEMSKTLGQPVIVENKSGANGNIGTDAVAKAAPDGYTLLMGGNSPLAMNVGLYPKLPYDPIKDFEPISRVATQPNLLAVHPKVPVTSLAELIQFAKANPGKLTYASNGNGSPQHLAAEQLKRMAGIDMLHVPYKGAAPNMSALLAGEVSLAFNIILLPLPHVQAGKLTGLAVASSKRSPLAPNIPTMTELGYPIDIDTWYGLLAPA
ncbi:MAG TPA: tripartite tricarboxylate transporter substrate binding protein, partial [Burkholderiales bacterium]|nr:tripartite tricarboxylate transporter substrate binding protein [Burkholderiales bacterium]